MSRMHSPDDHNANPGEGGPSHGICPLCGDEYYHSLAKHIREDCDA